MAEGWHPGCQSFFYCLNIPNMKQLFCYFDGACEPTNPGGNMGIGACIFATDGPQIKKENEIFTFSHFVPASRQNSNNVAEYSAFLALLKWIKENHNYDIYSDTIQIWGDSKLVIMQMQGAWKMKAGYYVPIAKECKELLQGLKEHGLKFMIAWHGREFNSYADKLSKAPMEKNNVVFKLQPKA